MMYIEVKIKKKIFEFLRECAMKNNNFKDKKIKNKIINKRVARII